MGRHSAPDDPEVDAATQTAPGGVAVGDETNGVDEHGIGGRHSSATGAEPATAPDDAVDGEGDEGGDAEGLELIEDALAGPDTDELHDAPTERIPVVGPVPDASAERTDVIPTVAGATEPELSGQVFEVGVDSSGPVVATPEGGAAVPAPAKARGGRRGTAGDLGLIRRHADVRARVIAAVVVPFVVFFVVFAVTGELTARSLIWIWVPAVTAGVLVGLLLDAGHRRYPDTVREPEDPTTEPRTH